MNDSPRDETLHSKASSGGADPSGELSYRFEELLDADAMSLFAAEAGPSRFRFRASLALVVLAVVGSAGIGSYLVAEKSNQRTSESATFGAKVDQLRTDPQAPKSDESAVVARDVRDLPAKTTAAPATAWTAVDVAEASRSNEHTALSGEWAMKTRVESSRLKRYQGMRFVYQLRLRQQGDRITGTGLKIRENDRRIASTARTPIAVDGVLNGDRLELNFTEAGRRRPSAGKLVLALASADTLRGHFSSTAAQSSGVVEIRR